MPSIEYLMGITPKAPDREAELEEHVKALQHKLDFQVVYKLTYDVFWGMRRMRDLGGRQRFFDYFFTFEPSPSQQYTFLTVRHGGINPAAIGLTRIVPLSSIDLQTYQGYV